MFMRKSMVSKVILAILVTLLLNITGCGSSTSNSSPGSTSAAQSTAQTAKPASTKPTNVTYDNYLKISLGMTYDDVKAFLGEGKKKEIKTDKGEATDFIEYTWQDQGKGILIKTDKGKVVLKSQTKLGKTTSKLTVDQFNKITVGMTFEDAAAILGSDYTETSYQSSNNSIRRTVVWMLPDSTHITLYLKDGKVARKISTLKS